MTSQQDHTDVVDVVVIGGGPGGAVCASELTRRGLSVIVLEKVTFPRFHLGESLLPRSLPILEAIGLNLTSLGERFLAKYGARFHDDIRKKKDRFAFDGAWKADIAHAFQVPRDEFDALLLDHARACGADVRHEHTATKLLMDGDDESRASGVQARSPDGTSYTITSRFVVDASGRDALTAHANKGTTKIEGLDQTSIFAHFEGVPREEGKCEGDVDIVLFASGDSEADKKRANWFWFIPFKDGRTSVGAVVCRSWIQAKRSAIGGADATALFDAAVAESDTAKKLLANATCLWPRKEATADFSYRVREIRGPGWLAIGDAGGFIDPLFSTGAHLAIQGGKLAADAIADVLQSPSSSSTRERARERERELLDAWEQRVRSASELFTLAVQLFYAGPLVEHLFVPDKHTALRRSITSLLAGDVFGDAIWLRDTRLRLSEMLGESAGR